MSHGNLRAAGGHFSSAPSWLQHWPYTAAIVLATSALAWPCALYGMLVISTAGDFVATGSFWIFGWPFVAIIAILNALHFVGMGAGEAWGFRPWFVELSALNEVARARDRLDTLPLPLVQRALHAVTRFPVWSNRLGTPLSVLVVVAVVGGECMVGGSESPNLWVILRGGAYAVVLNGAARFALSELLTRPLCRDLRRAVALAGADPYDGFAVSSARRIAMMVVPMMIALLVAVELKRVAATSEAYLAWIGLSGFVALGLSLLQFENRRSAVRDLVAACRALGDGRDAPLVTGTTDALLLEMAAEFTQAARRVDADRRASGDRYRALFDAALDCVVSMDHEGRIVEFNPAAERTFGRSRADVIGVELASVLVPPDARGHHRLGLKRLLATGEPHLLGQRIELSAMRADGGEFPVELAVTRIPGGETPLFTGFVRDITVRKQAEDAATASQRRAEEEAEIAAALLYVGQTISAHLDQPDLLQRVNQLAVETLWCDWSSTYIWDETRQSMRFRANAGSPAEVLAEVESFEFKLQEFPLIGAIRRGEVVEVPSKAAEGLVPGWVLARWGVGSMLAVPIVRREDVVGLLLSGYRGRVESYSEKQRRLAMGIAQAMGIAIGNVRLIADLQAASRVKSEFLSTMSHELRTPLNVVLGYLEMARDDDLSATDRSRALDRVDAASRDLLQLIEGTLEIGRVDADRDEVRAILMPLEPFWEQLGAACARLPRATDVRLEWHSVPDVELCTDPRKLTMIVRNLVGNALKFTTVGAVSVRLMIDPDTVILDVTDTGIGIREEDQEPVFEMFRQADGSDSRRHGGTGLGLYLVRRFAQQLGGSVTLESRAGEGSHFCVRLPRIPPVVLPVRARA